MSSDAAPSLADRITRDEPRKFDWADDVNSPAAETPPKVEESTSIPQTDGSGGPFGGSELHEPEYDVQVKLTDLQADPNNPLFSAKTFEQLDLKAEVLKGVIGMNFLKPSKVQEKTLPLLLLNPPANLIGQSQSGTGKTAAFVGATGAGKSTILKLLNRFYDVTAGSVLIDGQNVRDVQLSR